tara:strand:- start:4386 stop:5048 length:663 start_codon:yes stop_codon:yes gene_type:complete
MAKKSKKETFLLVSLKEEKAKQLAQVISNPSCRKILDYLATVDDSTETQISKDLKIPISTVHYNLTHLEKGGLVEVEEFHYSSKGKEVNHYKLANKFIIISPKSTDSVREKLVKKLGSLMPALLISVVVGGGIQMFSSMRMGLFGATDMVSPNVKQAAVEKSSEVAMDAAPQVMESAVEAAPPVLGTITNSFLQYPGYWFIAGVTSFVVIYLLWSLIKKD